MPTIEHLTDEERALLLDYPWPGTPVAAALDKLLRAYDALRARFDSDAKAHGGGSGIEHARAIEHVIEARRLSREMMASVSRESALPLTVHLLSEGRALCGKAGLPGDWDPGHRWVSVHNDDFGRRTHANCDECLAAVTEREP